MFQKKCGLSVPVLRSKIAEGPVHLWFACSTSERVEFLWFSLPRQADEWAWIKGIFNKQCSVRPVPCSSENRVRLYAAVAIKMYKPRSCVMSQLAPPPQEREWERERAKKRIKKKMRKTGTPPAPSSNRMFSWRVFPRRTKDEGSGAQSIGFGCGSSPAKHRPRALSVRRYLNRSAHVPGLGEGKSIRGWGKKKTEKKGLRSGSKRTDGGRS